MLSYKKLDQPELLRYLFHPRTGNRFPLPENCEDVNCSVDENITIGCRFFLNSLQSPSILYFHGNGEVVSDYHDIAAMFNKCGLNIFLASYRGYGWSNGSSTVTTMISDCRSILVSAQIFLNEKGIASPLFIMGKSIGSVPAIELAGSFQEAVKGLIIESGFAETLPLLKNLGLQTEDYSITEEEGFNNIEKIQSVKIPTLILHGSSDSLIPVNQAEKLQSYCGARSKKFFVVPGADHNTVIACSGKHYFSTIKSFVDEVTGESSWRNKRKKYRNSK